MTLSEFVSRIPNFSELSKAPSKLVPYFSLYLELGDPEAALRPSALNRLFNDARVRQPGSAADVIRKSSSFVRGPGGGYRLAHLARERMLNELAITELQQEKSTEHMNTSPVEAKLESLVSPRDVFVVYGRDSRLRSDFFSFLRALGLNPLEFGQMAALTGNTSSTTWEVVKTGFARTQACIVLFSPDEHVTLRNDLRVDDDPEDGMQPRPNVLIEAGMALALYPQRTILVRVGNVRGISDLSGIQYVSLTKDARSRNRLVSKLQTAGCEIITHGDDWLDVGDFSTDAIKEVRIGITGEFEESISGER